jgi:hypothetical protein
MEVRVTFAGCHENEVSITIASSFVIFSAQIHPPKGMKISELNPSVIPAININARVT